MGARPGGRDPDRGVPVTGVGLLVLVAMAALAIAAVHWVARKREERLEREEKLAQDLREKKRLELQADATERIERKKTEGMGTLNSHVGAYSKAYRR